MEKSGDKQIKIQDMTQKSRSQPNIAKLGRLSQDTQEMQVSKISNNSGQMKQRLDVKLPPLVQTLEGDTILETLNKSISMHNMEYVKQRKFHLIDSFVNQSFTQNNLFDSVSNSMSKQMVSPNGDEIKIRKHKFLSSHESMQKKNKLDEDQIEAKICFKKMQESFFKAPKEKPFTDLTADGNIKQFYKQNKDLDKILQENRLQEKPDGMFTVVLKKFDKKNLIPSKLGLIQENETDEKKKVQLRLNYMRFGDKYMKVLGHGMGHITHIKDFQLSQNRISNVSSQKLISSININAIKVDLSQNEIGTIGIQHISKLIQNRVCKIQILNLEENNLRSYNAIFLLNSLNMNSSLQILNLSKNFIQEDVAPALENYLKRGTLLELYLHWNCLKPQFGKVIFPSLHTNDVLHVLDLSNNSLGYSQSNESCINELSEFFAKNSAVVHLDISYNNIGYADTIVLAQALIPNKTLIGFHYAGNSGYLDVRGFLIPEKVPKMISGALHKKRIDSVNFVCKTVRDFRDTELRNNCWICEQWVQQTFEWSDEKEDPHVRVDPLFLSLNFENFLPLFYQKPAEEGGKLVLERMVPQGDLFYFFSNDSEFFLGQDKAHPQIPQTNFIENVLNYFNQEQVFNLKEINRRKVVQNEPIINIMNDYLPTIRIQPRIKPNEYIPPKIKKKRTKWTFETSQYAKYRQDDAEFVNLFFEYDWECAKVIKLIKDPLQQAQLKEFFRKRYKLIKDAYKYYASLSPSDDIWCIQESAFKDFIERLRIIDVKVTMDSLVQKFVPLVSGKKGTILYSPQTYFSFPDKKEEIMVFSCFQVDLKLKSTEPEPETAPPNTTELFFNPDKEKSKAIMMKHFGEAQKMYCENVVFTSGKNFRNIERGCVRYQFMELLVKVAEEKYIIKYPKTKTLVDAMRMFWDEYLLKEFTNPKYNPQNWRNDKFWVKDCDSCLRNYSDIVEYIYAKHSVKKIKNNPVPFMCLEELIEVANKAGLEQLVVQNIPQLAFNQSMNNQLDELGSDRIFQMSIYEFQEAFARIADEANFPPGTGIYQPHEISTNAQRQKMPLAYKIEGLIIKLYDCCDDQFKKLNPRPDKSFFMKNPEESDLEKQETDN